jgi:leucyl aminopeptidase (aminopeptidase T)
VRERNLTWYIELGKAADTLVNYVLKVKKDEDVLIYGDDIVDAAVLNATAAAVKSAGATPTIVIHETREISFTEPPKPLAAAMMDSDVTVEFSARAILYTQAQTNALKRNRAYICLTSLDREAMVRTLGWVNYPKMVELGDKLAEMTTEADEIKVTSPSGTNFTAKIGGRKFENFGSTADKRKVIMLGGQTGGSPIEETENGILAFDGNVWPPDEIKSNIRTPIKCKVDKGVITEISGGVEADILRRYLASFKDGNMYRIAHICFGYHPKARVTGDISEVERVWGCFQVGWGSQGPLLRPDLGGAFGWRAASHDDGIILKASICLDGEPVQKDGKFVHPELLGFIKEMGVEQ